MESASRVDETTVGNRRVALLLDAAAEAAEGRAAEEDLDAIQQALERDRNARQQRAEIAELRSRYRRLTPREREVMALVVTGLLNKQVAGELGTSEASVKVHRQHVMEKMRAGSLAALVRMADRIGIRTPKS